MALTFQQRNSSDQKYVAPLLYPVSAKCITISDCDNQTPKSILDSSFSLTPLYQSITKAHTCCCFFFLIFIYLFGSSRSQLQHVGSLIFTVPCRIFSCGLQTLRCSMWGLVPGLGIKPRPLALGTQSLLHWTTREVLI